jgi:hypothetical protein
MILHVEGLPLTTKGRVVTLGMEETTSRWEVAEVISKKQSRTTDKGLIITPSGLTSGSE